MSEAQFNILGAVIAGGQSKRMGDHDKLWLELAGKSLIARAACRLARQTGNVILNVNRHDERLDGLDYPVVHDRNADFQGPLAGILAVLGWAHDNRPDVTHVATVSADSPFFPEDLVAKLVESVEGRADDIAIAFCENFPQPVFSLWPISSLAPLERFLDETGNLKVMGFVRSQSWVRIDFLPGHPHAFFNINTPEDHAEAQDLIRKPTIEQ